MPDANDPKLKKKLEKEQDAIRQAANEMERREKKEAKSSETYDSTPVTRADLFDISVFRTIPLTNQLWTDRYAPRSLKEICGNKGQVEKLQMWLHDW